MITASLEVSELGGISCPQTSYPIEIQQGDSLVLYSRIKNLGTPVQILNYAVKLRFRRADKTVMEVEGIPWDNGAGQTKHILTPEMTATLMLSKNASSPQTVGVVMTNKNTADVKMSVSIAKCILVTKSPLE